MIRSTTRRISHVSLGFEINVVQFYILDDIRRFRLKTVLEKYLNEFQFESVTNQRTVSRFQDQNEKKKSKSH